MGSFADAVTAAMGTWFGSDMAETVAYNGADIPGHAGYGENLESQVERDAVRAAAQLVVRRQDVPAPAVRDTVVIAGATWSVVRIISGDAWTWRLEIERDVRATFGETQP